MGEYDEYQRCQIQITKLQKTLDYQQNIQIHKTIPNTYRPKPLETNDPSLTCKFQKQYEKLFFNHLEEVITRNAVNLEITKARLASMDVTQQSMDVTQQSMDVTQQSMDVTQQSMDVTQQSMNVTQAKRKRGQKEETHTYIHPHPHRHQPKEFVRISHCIQTYPP